MNKSELKDGSLIDFVLVFLRQGNKVWLAFKPPGGKIGAGCWNGYGGRFEPEKDLSLEHTAYRETLEEAEVRLQLTKLEKAGVIDFHIHTSDGGVAICRVHIYQVWGWDDVPQETATMRTPTFFETAAACKLPNIMPADKLWWPMVLCQGKKIRGQVSLTLDQQGYHGQPEFLEVENFDPSLEPLVT